MSEAKGRIKNMNKRDYESTNDYKKSIEILKNFVRDVLDGDIGKLRDFYFTDLTTYVGDIIDSDAVNDNVPEVIDYYGNNSRKIFCDIYIDDKACVPDEFCGKCRKIQ